MSGDDVRSHFAFEVELSELARLCRRPLADLVPEQLERPYEETDQPDLRGELRLGTQFRWKTFGVTIDSTVLEFVPHERRGANISGVLGRCTNCCTFFKELHKVLDK